MPLEYTCPDPGCRHRFFYQASILDHLRDEHDFVVPGQPLSLKLDRGEFQDFITAAWNAGHRAPDDSPSLRVDEPSDDDRFVERRGPASVDDDASLGSLAGALASALAPDEPSGGFAGGGGDFGGAGGSSDFSASPAPDEPSSTEGESSSIESSSSDASSSFDAGSGATPGSEGE